MSDLQPHSSQRRLRVAVLMGGTSSEREVSLVSGRMIAEALDPSRYEVRALDTRDLVTLAGERRPALTGADGPAEAAAAGLALPDVAAPATRPDAAVRPDVSARAAEAERPDVVFIALHGKGGEDGTVQGMLEVMGLPYTGSGVLASALAMDKVMTKRLFSAAGIPVIDGVFVSRSAAPEGSLTAAIAAAQGQIERAIGLPVFVKPNAGGSTCGCTLVTRAEALPAAIELALAHDDVALVERYVKGVEITIGVLDLPGKGATALPVIEIVPKSEFYDYESKYAEGGSEHIIPARLPESQLARAQEIALQCHALLGCRGVSRTDIIVSGDRLYVLEVNTIPGMTPTSLLPQAAAHAGISFSQVLDGLIGAALNRN